MPLTDTKIRNTKPTDKPVKLTDSRGLYLEIRPSGSKLWRYRYRIAGRENVYAIGEYPDITLAEARTQRDDARKLVKADIHPAHERKTARLRREAEKTNTFEAVTREWISKKRDSWSPYYCRQVERMMEANVFPEIGGLPIKSVSAAHLLQILHRVEARGAHSVANLLRQWCSAIFRYATATLRVDSDPAAALKGAITKPKVKHYKPLSRSEISALLETLGDYGGYRTTVIALRLLLLTFVRPGELRGAEWKEIDLEHAEWRIPAERMKMRAPHIVPLSTQSVALLRELQTLTGGQRWLFPNHRRPRTRMSKTTLNRALERMGYGGKFSAHGFRATASTILNETGFRPDVIERQLAHQERNRVRASYNQAEYLPERRELMQAWADMIDTFESRANVVSGPFRQTA